MLLNGVPSATRAVIRRARSVSGQYTLIGGTALAIQVGHRMSEDLDFVTTGGRLDAREILGIVDRLATVALRRQV